MKAGDYAALRRMAQAVSRHADPDDLVQDALMAGLQAGRLEDRAWLAGTLRNLGRMQIRSDIRRRQREAFTCVGPEVRQPVSQTFVDALPLSLRIVMKLVLTGHSRQEIRHLLRLSDTALRQRIVQLRRRCHGEGLPLPDMRLKGPLAFGCIRQSLRRVAAGATLASHDPDGHLFAINFTPVAHKGQARGNLDS